MAQYGLIYFEYGGNADENSRLVESEREWAFYNGFGHRKEKPQNVNRN